MQFVHHILYTKIFSDQLAILVDDFCAYTLAIIWCLSNIIFWPLLDVYSNGVFYAIDVGFFVLNIYRFYWNWKHEKRGIAMYRAWIAWLQQWWRGEYTILDKIYGLKKKINKKIRTTQHITLVKYIIFI